MTPSTRERLLQAFLELGKEKPYEKITITEIVEKAGITRKTFYYYFEDIFALGEAAMEKFLEPVFKESMEIAEPKKSLKHFLKCLIRESNTIERAMHSPYHLYLMQIMLRKLKLYLERILDEKGVLDQMTRGEAEMYIRVLTHTIAGLGIEGSIKTDEEVDRMMEQLFSLFKISLN